MERNAVKLV